MQRRMYVKKGAIVVMKETKSLEEAARIAGCSNTTLRNWVKSGLVAAKKDEKGNWVVEKSSLLDFISAKQKCEPRAHDLMEVNETILRLRHELAAERALNHRIMEANIKLQDAIQLLSQEFQRR